MNNKIIEEVMEIPKITIALEVIGFLIIIYSFIRLENPFFLLVGICFGALVMYLGYDQWHKRLTDKKLNNLTYRLDSIVYPVK